MMEYGEEYDEESEDQIQQTPDRAEQPEPAERSQAASRSELASQQNRNNFSEQSMQFEEAQDKLEEMPADSAKQSKPSEQGGRKQREARPRSRSSKRSQRESSRSSGKQSLKSFLEESEEEEYEERVDLRKPAEPVRDIERKDKKY